tara:strand:+ start:15705 stop:16751 length:1047 start_codon:yes stop_codon:yes gene_type:complete
LIKKTAEELTLLLENILLLSGANNKTAKRVSEALISSSLVGVDSHGVWQIIRYVKGIKNGDYNPKATPSVVSQTNSTATISGNWNFGHVGAKLAIETAIKKAKKTDISIVGLIEAGHIGRLGEYAEIAAKENMCSIIMGGGYGVQDPRAVPYGGRDKILSTNPIAIGFPIENENPFIMDYATTTSAASKIRKAAFKDEMIPLGYLVDKDGVPTQDAKKMFEGGGQSPFGEHKGYALMVAVELLGRILNGADEYSNTSRGDIYRNQGVSFIVFKSDVFSSKNIVNEKGAELRWALKNSTPAKGFERVLVPGDLEEEIFNQRSVEGIPIEKEIWTEMIAIQNDLLGKSKI